MNVPAVSCVVMHWMRMLVLVLMGVVVIERGVLEFCWSG
jgi:hypothetical protein